MTSWNYRIVRYRDESGYGLHEVFYDEAGNPTNRTEEPISFHVSTQEGAEELILLLEQALNDARGQPVLAEPEKWPDEPVSSGFKMKDPIPDVPTDIIEALQDKIGQAYQIIGYLVFGENPRPSEGEQIRVLDYYADETAYNPNFLPWPRHSDANQD